MFKVDKRYASLAVGGSLLSRTADEAAGPALLLFAYSKGSAGDGGVIYGAVTIAAALGAPVLGRLLQRRRPGRALALAMGVYGAALGGCAYALRGQALLGAVVVAVVAGVLAPAVAAGWSSLLTSPDPALARRLVAWDSLTYNVSSLLGPALAGVAFAVGGGGAPLAMALAVLALGCVSAACMPVPPRGLEWVQEPSRRWWDGLHAIATDRVLCRVTVGSAVAFAGVAMFSVAAPAVGAAWGDAGYGAWLLALVAACAAAAAVVISKLDLLRRPIRLFLSGAAVATVGLLATATGYPAAVIGGAALLGLGDGAQLASVLHIRHERSAARVRAHVFATGASVKISAAGLGALVAADLMASGTGSVFLVGAALQMAAMALVAVQARRPLTSALSATTPP